MFAAKKLPTAAVVAYGFGLRRSQNGTLNKVDVQREIAKDIIQNSLFIMGSNYQMAEKVMAWANALDNPPPKALRYEEIGLAVELIDGYEDSRDKPTAIPAAGDFPFPVGKRGMLKARILAIRERNRAGKKTFANGKTWMTTSHIKMEVSEPADDKSWQAIWYATGGRESLAEFWDAYYSGSPLMVMATAREIPDAQSPRPVNLTLVRIASPNQLAKFKKRQEKLAAVKSA